MDVALLGDSLTEGWPGAAYVPLLQSRLPQHRFRNHGRAGDGVADLLVRMRHTGLDPADMAVIWIGANDAVAGELDGRGVWRWEERLVRLRRDYEELLTWARGRVAVLLLVRPIILEAEGSFWEARAAELGALVEDLGSSAGAQVLDLAPAFGAARAAGDGPFTIDGVHLTDAGAQVVAAAFAAAIERAAPFPTTEGGS